MPGGGQIGHVTAAGRAVVPWGDRFARAGLVVTVFGFVAQVFSIVTRGFSAGRLPLGNMYEFTSVICATVIKLADGLIVDQTVVQAWDES